MPLFRLLLTSLALLGATTPALAQMNVGQCIVAGRVTDKDRWSPRFEGIELLAARGRVVTSASREALSDVQQVRLTRPALLTRCDGDGAVARGDDLPRVEKEPQPAVSPGAVEVERVSFPRLRKGGELVELQLRALPHDRVVMVRQ